MHCVSLQFLCGFYCVLSLPSFSALSHKSAHIYLHQPHLIQYSRTVPSYPITQHYPYSSHSIDFPHSSTKHPPALSLSHFPLVSTRAPRNSQRATRTIAHLAVAPLISLHPVGPLCLVWFLCHALHSIATHELINTRLPHE